MSSDHHSPVDLNQLCYVYYVWNVMARVTVVISLLCPALGSDPGILYQTLVQTGAGVQGLIIHHLSVIHGLNTSAAHAEPGEGSTSKSIHCVNEHCIIKFLFISL